MKETAKERREKVIGKYSRYFVNVFEIAGRTRDITVGESENATKRRLEKFLTEIHIADSPQGPEDVEPLTDICRAHGTVGCDCLKKKKIEEVELYEESESGGFPVSRFPKIVQDKINELVRRVNEG